MTPPGADGLEARVRSYLGALPPPARTRLAAALGVGELSEREPDAARLAAVLRGPGAASRVLATLSADARHLLLVLAIRGGVWDLWQTRDAIAARRDWKTERFEAAFRELAGAGLVNTDPVVAGTGLVPGMAEPLFPHVFAAVADAQPDSPQPPRFAFFLAAVAAHCVENPPLVKQEGGFYAKWIEKAAERLAYPGLVRSFLESAVVLLHALGSLREREQSGRRVLLFSPEGAAAAFAAAPEEIALAAIADRWREPMAARTALAVLERAGAGAEARGLEALLAVALEMTRLGGAGPREMPVSDAHPIALAQGLAWLRHLGLVTVEHAEEGSRFRRAPPAGPPGKWIVQPNFDVLVPEDAPPVEVARLGMVAELVRLDRVATFRITRESVQRGAALVEGFDAVAVLAARSSAPVPENVAATVRGWNRRIPPMRPCLGAVVVAQTPSRRRTCATARTARR